MVGKRRAAAAAAALTLVAALALLALRTDGSMTAGGLFEWTTKSDPIFSDTKGDTVAGVDADDPNFKIQDLDYDSPFERMTGAEETRCPMCAGQKAYHTYLHSLERGGDAADQDSPSYHPEGEGEGEGERDPAYAEGRGRVPGDEGGTAAAAPAAEGGGGMDAVEESADAGRVAPFLAGPKGALQRLLRRVMGQIDEEARQYRLTDVAQRREAVAAKVLNEKRLLQRDACIHARMCDMHACMHAHNARTHKQA